jgi:hypothetical protein
MNSKEIEDSPELKQAVKLKQPRHVTIANRQLVTQYESACRAHAKLAEEIKELATALSALGWPEE